MPDLDEQERQAQGAGNAGVARSSEDDLRAKARAALVGTTVAGRYVVRGVLGHGGMGAVYEAEHIGLGKRVAIKFVDAEFATDERIVARFAREARAMSTLESAHVVAVIDAGTEGGRPFLVMELLRGEDLGQRLRREARIPRGEAMHVVAQVLKGLARAHAAGIVHRDLKPDNVFLIRSDTDPLFAKIVDFGISKIERPKASTTPLALTGRGTVLGTPFYMSPEQAQASSDVDARADLYSVGAILFECLSGRPPHTGETYEQVILSICMRDAPDLRAIAPATPEAVAMFVARALSRDKQQRFASAERMLAALHDVAPEERTRVPLDQGPAQTLMSPGTNGGGPGAHVPPPPSSDPILSAGTLVAGSNVGNIAGAATPARSSDPGVVSSPNPSRPSTPHAPAAPATPVSPLGVAKVSSVSAELSASQVARVFPKKRSTMAVVGTALAATLLGIGATVAIVLLVGKKELPDAQRPLPTLPGSSSSMTRETPPTITSAVATSPSAESSAPAPPSGPAPIVPASARASASSASSRGAARPASSARPSGASGSSAPKASGSSLDLQRDFP